MSGIGYDEAAFVYDFDIDADDAAPYSRGGGRCRSPPLLTGLRTIRMTLQR